MPLPLIFSFVFLTAIINLLTLKTGHNWGGDWGQYIIHAQNLLTGKPYTQGIMLEKTIVYPPGFPLMLAPLIKTFGLNLQVLKGLNVLFWFSSLYVLWLLYKDRLSNSSALACVLLLSSSSFFFVFKQNILSDIPFMFFTLAGVWALTRGHMGPAFVFMFLGILTRSAGLVLCAASAFYFLFIRRDLRIVAGSILSAAAALGVQYAICGGIEAGFWRTFSHDAGGTIVRLAQGASTVWQSMVWALCPGQTPATSLFYTAIEGLFIILSPILYLAAIALFIQRCRARTLSLIDCFCFFYLGMLFVWASFGDSPQNFARYTLPLIGLLPMLAIQGAGRWHKEQWVRWTIGVLIMINLVNVAVIFRFNDDELVRYQPNQELFGWINEHLEQNEHYMIWEPRTVALMTHRVGTTLAWLANNPPEQWQQILTRSGVGYVFLSRLTDAGIIHTFETTPWAKQVWQNEYYVVFKTIR